MNALKKALVISVAIVLSACASSHVLVGATRQPLKREDVKIYLDPPAKYETVALLEASDLGANGFSAQSRMNKVVNRLKTEAANLGANGILLQGFDTQYIGSVNSGFANTAISGNSAYTTGMGYSAAQSSKVGRAVAIYVSGDEFLPVDPRQQKSIMPHTSAVPAEQQKQSPLQVTPASSDSIPAISPRSNWRNWGNKTVDH